MQYAFSVIGSFQMMLDGKFRFSAESGWAYSECAGIKKRYTSLSSGKRKKNVENSLFYVKFQDSNLIFFLKQNLVFS